MKKISGATFWLKIVLPILWFSVFGILIIVSLILIEGYYLFLFAAVEVMMIIFGYVLFKKLVWDLADEVYDCGETLLIRKGKKEQRVNLREIINISYTTLVSPERIAIYVRSSGSLGREMVFTPPVSFNPLSSNPLVGELIDRVDKARLS